MSIIIGPAIAVVTSFLALTVVLLSFIGLEKFELPIAANSTLTGYPTWHPDVPAYLILDVGKLWSPIGLLYNVAEISLLACIHYGGKITAIKYWAWVLRYVVIVIIGQSIQVALVITFFRLYFTTRRKLHEHESSLPINIERENPEPSDPPEDAIPHEPSSEYPLPLSFLPQPKQIVTLIVASSVHLFGDSIFVIFLNHPNAYLLSALSYALSYGIFAYYIWLDTHCYRILPRKRIYAPETSTWKLFGIDVRETLTSLDKMIRE
ncbi:20164_t:CDS:2 [Cetraspora pellucida]|uniref:20164_t:CDS:1 n=1 Tax=Cetraspora pellucida TaxID=1433469 RepID=A0A9N9HYE4_9GLOM|nr:20164_t:CDS:2 [Cetraspora pellucida]